MEERKYVCKYCRKRFPCGKSLGGHIRTHMTEERSNNIINNRNNINNKNVVDDDSDADEDNNISMLVKLEGVRNKNRRDLWCAQQEDEDVVADDDVVPNNNNIYGLRENPKKTMRFVHSGGSGANNEQQQQHQHQQQQQQQQHHHQQEERFCKECGKGFPSLKALCGHMACHSEKEKRTTRFEEESGVGVHDKKLKLVMDSHSDTETCCAAPPRRSKRMKVKTISNLSSNNHHYPFSSSSTSCAAAPLANNGSSPVSEVEQEQQEEVARCLMLLSRDSSGGGFNKGRFAPAVAESSGNNSVILEANKSSSPDTLIGFINANNYNNNHNNSVSKHHLAYDLVEKKLLKVKDIKLKKSAEFGAGYGSKTKMLVDSGVSNNGGGGEFKSSKHSNTASVVRKLVVEDFEYDRRTDGTTTTTTTTRKFDSRKRSNNNNNNNYDHSNSLGGHNLGGGGVSSSKKMENAFVGTKGCKKYHDECLEGGERDNACSYAYDSLDVMSDENSSDTESFPAPRSQKVKSIDGKKKSTSTSTSKAKKKLKLNKASSKKSKEHECPICYKVFKSGQALGGHKRSHFIGGSEENTTVVIKQVVAPCLIDLNLPAPVDE